MNGKGISQSQKKFNRKEKARIRRSVMDVKEQEKLIKGLYPSANKT